MSKWCKGFLLSMINMNAPNVKLLFEVWMIREFIDVFLDELSWLSPIRQRLHYWTIARHIFNIQGTILYDTKRIRKAKSLVVETTWQEFHIIKCLSLRYSSSLCQKKKEDDKPYTKGVLVIIMAQLPFVDQIKECQL